MLFSVLLHESGHLCAAFFLGLKISRIRFLLTGAQIKLASPLLSYRDEFILSFAGPAFGFLGFALCYPVSLYFSESAFFAEFLYYFALISLCLSIFNLIPVKTFDGGRMLYCAFAKMFGIRSAERAITVTTFLSVFSLWCLSVYLMMRTLSGLTLFVFSAILFARFFISENIKE